MKINSRKIKGIMVATGAVILLVFYLMAITHKDKEIIVEEPLIIEVQPTLTVLVPLETMIATTPTATPTPVLYYTEEDIIVVAQTIRGEACGLTYEEMAQVAWCICNRVDCDEYPDTIMEVITQSGQFHGYNPYNEYEGVYYEVAEDVVTRWNAERNGETVYRELAAEYIYFYGDGEHNHFRTSF